jgi:hypothetical protein
LAVTKSFFTALGVASAMFLVGCSTPLPPGAEPGPHGTMAYNIVVEASAPARIEVNGDDVGNTPLTLKVFGDRDGTFHDFGSYHYVVRALPLTTNQYAQTRFFGTGKAWSPEDRIPERIYFDMNQPAPVYSYPPPGPPAYYAPPPVYYYPPPYYYGPGVRFHFGPGVYHRHRHR